MFIFIDVYSLYNCTVKQIIYNMNIILWSMVKLTFLPSHSPGALEVALLGIRHAK